MRTDLKISYRSPLPSQLRYSHESEQVGRGLGHVAGGDGDERIGQGCVREHHAQFVVREAALEEG